MSKIAKEIDDVALIIIISFVWSLLSGIYFVAKTMIKPIKIYLVNFLNFDIFVWIIFVIILVLEIFLDKNLFNYFLI